MGLYRKLWQSRLGLLQLLSSVSLYLYKHVNILFLKRILEFLYLISYWLMINCTISHLSCNLTVGISIIILLIVCKCFRLQFASEWPQWLEINAVLLINLFFVVH